jgi:hypothetical protein
MSWLSTIKNNIIAALTAATPAPEQQAVHDAATQVAAALGNALSTLDTVAEGWLNEFVTAKFGSLAGAMEYEALSALKRVIDARQATIAQPGPTKLS